MSFGMNAALVYLVVYFVLSDFSKYSEKTHANTGRTCKARFEPVTFLLRVNRAAVQHGITVHWFTTILNSI